MSVAPHAGVIDFGTFTPPTDSRDGIQGEVPKPLIGQQNYVLTASGWAPASGGGSVNSVTGTAPIVSSGGANPAISIGQATTSTDGYLSSTDWNTFNSKLSTQVYPGAGIPNSTGTAWDTSYSVTGTGNVVLSSNLPSGSVVGTTDTQTLTNKRVTPRVSTTASSATPTINTDNTDQFGLTAQAVDITSFTTNLSGTPTDGQKLWIYIVGTAARAITWGASFESSTATLPTTTVSTNRLDVGFVWNVATSKWRCVAVA
jgi:hypothetical protein